ncbi:heme-binding protein 1-like [Megalops cyprinoides]|uniref:heme-binding protein 1-like n=1 Tax=Megalops cyprinoides TaxID=118141 RepID=UPI001864F258|nr:heme-binding protein 1-like [Megalops cyprinoides]
MNQGGCRLNGGGGGDSRSGPQRGVITVEDLDSFSEDQLPDSSEENDAMEEEEEERLLHYWQDIGRVHQVNVPRDMAAPIQQLTTNIENTQDREKVPFTLITRKEKCGEMLYEKRHYEKANWACVVVQEPTYEQSICLGFMKLMRYICQQNSSGEYLGMTIPIVTVVRVDDSRSVLSREVTVAYYLPRQHQAQPPRPLDLSVVMQEWPATIIYSRPFRGVTNELSILTQFRTLAEVLESPAVHLRGSFIVAGYSSPAAANRCNEIWLMEQP